jgi:hypothetical protein
VHCSKGAREKGCDQPFVHRLADRLFGIWAHLEPSEEIRHESRVWQEKLVTPRYMGQYSQRALTKTPICYLQRPG